MGALQHAVRDVLGIIDHVLAHEVVITRRQCVVGAVWQQQDERAGRLSVDLEADQVRPEPPNALADL